jgi:hypothetical protein
MRYKTFSLRPIPLSFRTVAPFGAGTENSRVGGSIPSLGTTRADAQYERDLKGGPFWYLGFEFL